MTECTDEERWAASIAECDTLADFNKYIVPRMRSQGDLFKTMAATEAKKRGYRADKIAGVYIDPVKMVLTKGRNVIKVGWSNDTLYTEFADGRTYSTLGVPKEEFYKLCRSPFPDKLYATNIRGKYSSAPCPTQSSPTR
jgi:hypothetical protein